MDVNQALLEWHADLIERGEHALAGKLLKAIGEARQPKAQAVITALVDGGLQGSEIANICMVMFCAT